MENRVAVMQPYIFPYIGYMNLVIASDYFVFYDNVSFIKNGWINRNRIILSGDVFKFTIPVKGASQNKLIMEVQIENLGEFSRKFLQQIYVSYKRAKFFDQAMYYIEGVLQSKTRFIGDLAADSIIKFFDYVGIQKNFIKSSDTFSELSGLGRVERLAEITKKLNSKVYLNASGGDDLYQKSDFATHGVELYFIKPDLKKYHHVNSQLFHSHLSIIDLLMNLSVAEIHDQLNSYQIF